MGFKIGDKVVFNARPSLSSSYSGRAATVKSVLYGSYDYSITFEGDHGFDYAAYADELTAVETLKLEKGATVRLKDGVDEWVVNYVSTMSDMVGAERGRDGIGMSAQRPDLVVVRGKPAPPKPDYYVNCKGAEPKEGDVFSGGKSVAEIISGSRYRYLGVTPSAHDLHDKGKSHGIGTNYYPRTLLARDGKPYVGG